LEKERTFFNYLIEAGIIKREQESSFRSTLDLGVRDFIIREGLMTIDQANYHWMKYREWKGEKSYGKRTV